MPLDPPHLASVEPVQAAPRRVVCWVQMCGISRRSTISSAIGRQIKPLPWVAMKLMSPGVTSSAAIVRSPSFSRSSSSQTMTILPAFMSSTISSIGLNGIFDAPLGILHLSDQPRLQQALHILAYNVRLQVHAIACPQFLQVRVREGLEQDGDRE